MSGALETGLRLAERGRAALDGAGTLEKALRRFRWFYAGAEFCENLLPDAAWHEREVSFFLEKGASVCVLTPPLGEKGLKRLRPVFKRLASVFGRDPRAAGRVEVTVNDFGALELAAETGLKLPLSAGRLLYENMFFADRTKMAVINGEAVRLFRSLGVSRFEFSTTGRLLSNNFSEAAKYGFKPSDIALTLHYPYLNLTTARACAVGLPDIGPEDSVRGVACRRECQACSFEAGHPLVNEKLLVRGNTVFLKFPEKFYSDPATLLKRRINRLVYSPFL
ncbi:MAG TPA: hypothetical protein DEQ38_11930 [Elusimicrobia bacterium]|nr:MAG: hypothetical protein A2089_05370 [Elusimicrobia bacterium GWD2_63_28]HCC48806.1 hypothetical protein [Elusimicrobiota bacterium]